MVFDWSFFAKLASDLVSNDIFNSKYKDNSEQFNQALYRTCISRFYYACFKPIEDFVKENSIKVEEKDSKNKKIGSHERIIRWVAEKDRKLGNQLRNLKFKRKKSDYDKNVIISKTDCLDAEEQYKKITKLWNEIKNNQKY